MCTSVTVLRSSILINMLSTPIAQKKSTKLCPAASLEKDAKLTSHKPYGRLSVFSVGELKRSRVHFKPSRWA